MLQHSISEIEIIYKPRKFQIERVMTSLDTAKVFRYIEFFAKNNGYYVTTTRQFRCIIIINGS